MDLASFNESDVREEIAVPMLSALGYAKGTDADILREQELRLAYPHPFLGRKKPGRDPELRGRPDYVLRVIGVCRWVFEIKAPSASLDRDVIEQALSYARHPEINGELVALLNGREFQLFRVTQTADEQPIFATEKCEPRELAAQLKNILSPAALRRDRPPSIDLGQSLGGNLRSKEPIQSGSITYDFGYWEIIECPAAYKEHFKTSLDQAPPTIPGTKYQIRGGDIQRTSTGAIVAVVYWNAPYQQMEDLLNEKGLDKVNYVCLDGKISDDPDNPSMFDSFITLRMDAGEEIFDMRHQQTVILGMPSTAEASGQAVGYLKGRLFLGTFQQETVITTFLNRNMIKIAYLSGGKFEVRL